MALVNIYMIKQEFNLSFLSKAGISEVNAF